MEAVVVSSMLGLKRQQTLMILGLHVQLFVANAALNSILQFAKIPHVLSALELCFTWGCMHAGRSCLFLGREIGFCLFCRLFRVLVEVTTTTAACQVVAPFL